MLIVNNKILNLTDPKTEQEKRVSKELAQLVEDYKLSEGNIVSVVYPKEYIKENKNNKSRPYKPASFKISYRDVLRTPSGTEDWRFAERVDPGKNDIGSNYSPAGNIFTGSWQLGIESADLLYFLLNISSRMEGGKNASNGKRPYMVVENKVADAKAFASKEIEIAYIKLSILQDMSEEKLRTFAKQVGINTAETEDLSLLRKTTYGIVSIDKDGYKKVSAFMGVKSTPVESELMKDAMELAFKAISTGVLELRKNEYVFTGGDQKDQPFFNTGNKPDKEKQLATFLAKSPVEFDLLSELCGK